MFQKLKQRIKIAKIGGIIFGVLFIAMIFSNIYLLCKVNKLENKINSNPTISKSIHSE